MKWYTSIRFWFTLGWALLLVPAGIATPPLQPGGTLTVNCAVENELTKREISARGTQLIAARVTLSLDSAGTLLTVNVQNTSARADAVLYAVDLGLPNRFVAVNRMQAIEVMPPASAAAVPVSMVSSSFWPGSRRWTCMSMRPGQTRSPVASMVWVA